MSMCVCVCVCLLALFCFVHWWGGQITAERIYEMRLFGDHILSWVWGDMLPHSLSVIYDKYAIQSRKRKMWLLSFRKITVKSYSVENLNMSREEERKASGSEAAGRGQCFPCLFSKFWVGWGLVYNEKDNNGMMTLFSFHPVRRSARRDCGYGRISVHLISRFFWNAMRLCSQCSRQFLRVRLWCLKKMQHEIELVLCGRFAHISTAAVIKQARRMCIRQLAAFF